MGLTDRQFKIEAQPVADASGGGTAVTQQQTQPFGLTDEQKAAMTYTADEMERGKFQAPSLKDAQREAIATPSQPPRGEGNGAMQSQPKETGQAGGTASQGGLSYGPVAGEESPSHIADWSNGWEKGLQWLWTEKGQQAKPAEVIADYNSWAKENGQAPLDALQFYPWLMKYDATKSIGENEAEEKKRKRREKWEQIGNVLIHAGNFIGTLTGAPSMKLESGVQLTQRQQKMRDDLLAQRRNQANDMLSLYYKQRAEERQRELANSTINYNNIRADEVGRESGRKDALNASRIDTERARQGVYGAQQGNYESQRRERDALRPLKEANLKSSTVSHYASANASNERASKTRTERNRLNRRENFIQAYKDNPELASAYEKKYRVGEYAGGNKSKEWSNNMVEDFMNQVELAKKRGTTYGGKGKGYGKKSKGRGY